jgi:hypothetical protein
VLHTFQACAFDRSATSPSTSNLLKLPGGIARGRKGTGGGPSDQIYGGAEPEGSAAGGTAGGGGGTVCISLAALLGGAGW